MPMDGTARAISVLDTAMSPKALAISRISSRQSQREASQNPNRVDMISAKERRSVVSGSIDQSMDTPVSPTRPSSSGLLASVARIAPGRVAHSASVTA